MGVERRLDRVVGAAHQLGQELLGRLRARLGSNPVLDQIDELRVADHSTFQRHSRAPVLKTVNARLIFNSIKKFTAFLI